MHSSPALAFTFHALAEGTWRSMIHALVCGEARSAGELGRQFRSAQPIMPGLNPKYTSPNGNGSGLVTRHERLRRTDAIERHPVGRRGAVDQLTALLTQEDQHGR